MDWYTKAVIPVNVYKSAGMKPKEYNKAIYTFDIETTSMFLCNDGKYRKESDFTIDQLEHKPNNYYAGIMYIWQFGINEKVYYGRTFEQLKEFFERLQKVPGIKIIFVHNLSFEFQFLLNIFQEKKYNFEVFARAPHKVMKCVYGTLEFHCTYFMSSCSLDNLAKNYNLKVQKKTGDLDYSKLRGYSTKLSYKELQYCEYDCLVVYYYIKELLKRYKNVSSIPLTSTGQIRRVARKEVIQDANIVKRIRKNMPSVDIFELLKKMFLGGYVHANKINAMYNIEDVDSYDFSSSYPARMIMEKFPVSSFIKVKPHILSDKESNKYSAFYRIHFYDVTPKGSMSLYSYSKVVFVKNWLIDNGRIESADELELLLTDVDFETFNLAYNYEKMEVLETYISQKDYLPKGFVEYIFDLFDKKTSLKHIPGREEEYMISKYHINGCYGMMVTNDIQDNVVLNENFQWVVQHKTREEVAEELLELSKSNKTFLMYQWGVWVTAYARNALWKFISLVNDDVIYCDTDSIKMINSELYKDEFEKENERIINRTKEMIKERGLKVNYPPKDSQGIEHYMGVFEHEDDYPVKEFKTLGAKKYAYIDRNNKLHITLSGVSKNAASTMENGLDDFEEGYIFYPNQSGRKLAWYLSNMGEIQFTDCQGNDIVISDQRFGICIEPSTYQIGIPPDFAEWKTDSVRLDYLSRFNYKSGVINYTERSNKNDRYR